MNKMIEYIDKAITYTNGYSYDDFCRDDKTINATIFVVSQIGELTVPYGLHYCIVAIPRSTGLRYQDVDEFME